MKCPNCRNILDDTARFCSNCGYNFKTKKSYSSATSGNTPYIICTALIITVLLSITLIFIFDRIYPSNEKNQESAYTDNASTTNTASDTNSVSSIITDMTSNKIVQNDVPFGVPDFAELTVKNVEFIHKITSKRESSYSRSYTADDGKIYFVVNGTLKNLQKEKNKMYKLVDANVYYSDGYKYDCMLLWDKNGSLQYAGIDEWVDPLQNESVKFVTQLPKEAQSDKKPIKIVFEIDNEKFEYICR